MRTIMRYYYTLLEWNKSKTLTAPNTHKYMEQQKLSFIVGGNAKQYRHVGRQFGSTKLNILLPFNPSIVNFGIYPN